MHEWKAHWLTEWKLLRRSRFLYVILLLGAALLVLLHLAVRDVQDAEGYAKTFLHMYVWVFSLLATLYGVYLALRDVRLGIHELRESWAVHTGKLWLTRGLVSFLPFLLLALIPVFTYVALSLMHKSTLYGPVAWILASGVVTMWYSLVIGLVIGGLIKHMASYLLAFFVWLGHSLIVHFVLSRQWPASVGYAGYAIPFDFEALGYYSGLFGFHVPADYWGQRGFYFFLAIALILLWIGIRAWKRKESRIVLGCSLAALFCVTAAGFSLSYYKDVRSQQERAYELFLQQVKQAGEVVHTDRSGLHSIFTIQSYTMSMSYTDHDQLAVNVELILDRGEESAWRDLVLTLMPFFTVDRVEVNGEPMPFQQSWVHIRVPQHNAWSGQEQLNITLSYTGQVHDIRDTYFGIFVEDHNLIKFQTAQPNYLYLTHAWFPVLGEWPLYEYGNRIENPDAAARIFGQVRKVVIDLYPDISPADFKISVDYPKGISIRSNLTTVEETKVNDRVHIVFEGEQVKGAVLLGGRLEETRFRHSDHPSMDFGFIHNQALYAEHAQSVAAMMYRTWLDVTTWFQIEPAHTKMTFIPTTRMMSPERYHSGNQNRTGSSSIHTLYPRSGVYFIDELYTRQKSRLQSLRYPFILHMVEEEQLFGGMLKGTQQRLFAGVVSAYLAHKYEDLPYSQAVVNVPAEVRADIGSYMSSHTEEQVFETLQQLYTLLLEQPSMSVKDITARIYLQEEG